MGIRSTLAGYLFSKHSMYIYIYIERVRLFDGRFARNVMDYSRNYHFVDFVRDSLIHRLRVLFFFLFVID